MSAHENWSHRREVNDFMMSLRRAHVPAPFLQTVHAEEQLESEEHHITLLVSLQQMRFSIEKSLIEAIGKKQMIKARSFAIDLNIVRNLIWKIEQDSKRQ